MGCGYLRYRSTDCMTNYTAGIAIVPTAPLPISPHLSPAAEEQLRRRDGVTIARACTRRTNKSRGNVVFVMFVGRLCCAGRRAAAHRRRFSETCESRGLHTLTVEARPEMPTIVQGLIEISIL